MKLVVKDAFGTYKPGDEITDPDAIKAILGSEQAAYVVQVAADVEQPQKKADKA
ncbi:hypothetical protein ABNQ24_12300 [Ralstonia pseudosolanacearum]|uniref:hypothetical protein n=1 Tax=Ralstonia solanacearum species complex TaxID=3116862 RepID=UPI00336AE22B